MSCAGVVVVGGEAIDVVVESVASESGSVICSASGDGTVKIDVVGAGSLTGRGAADVTDVAHALRPSTSSATEHGPIRAWEQ